ncbi:MAG TPA: MFS transporter, partial [Beijerinckiaceae bacterium]|nr:MFS transporter [Beijerinckiaceae bacterium]
MSNVRVREEAAGPGAHSGAIGERRSVPRVLVFTIIALSLLMMSVDSTIVATALESLRQGLHTSINWAGWTITAYSFGFVLIVPISGILCERYGRRRVFLASTLA